MARKARCRATSSGDATWGRARPGDPRGLAGSGCDRSGIGGLGNQAEANLPPASQLDIDLGEQLGVEQRAVLDPLRPIDAVTGAQRVEAVLCARMARAGENQRVDHPRQADRPAPAALQLVIQEAEVEAGIVRDERRISR